MSLPLDVLLANFLDSTMALLEGLRRDGAFQAPVCQPVPFPDIPAIVESQAPDDTRPLFSGKPHNDWNRKRTRLEPIFLRIFPNWHAKSYEAEILPIANIGASTIYGWRAHWRRDPFWRPWHTHAHGISQRRFTDSEEGQLVDVILSNYIANGQLFTSATFRDLASQFWKDLGKSGEFTCSDHFLVDFKRRNNFSSRRFHIRRRTAHGTEESIEQWTADIRNLLTLYDDNLQLVVNCDETAWRIIPSGLLTWARSAPMA
jgi:hypothetical protein